MTQPSIDADKLRLIVEVAQLGSLSRVALVHHTSQPYVSKVIAQMEGEWGARIFRRTGRGMVLTDFGEAVLPRIREWLADSQRLLDDFKALAGTAAGEVRLATLPSFSSPVMSALFVRVRDRFPGIRLRFMEGYMEQIESWLQNGQADLGICLRYGGEPREGDLHLADFDIDLCGAPGDPLLAGESVAFAALSGLPLVVHSQPGPLYRHLLGLFEERGMALRTVLEVNSVAIQRDVAASGCGYALLTHNAVADALQAGRIGAARVVDPPLVHHLDLSVSRNGPLGSATREVMALLRETVRDLLASGELKARAMPARK